MCILSDFVVDLHNYLTHTSPESSSAKIIRVHTKKLDKLGDLSFPLRTQSWSRFLTHYQRQSGDENSTIFDYAAEQDKGLTLEEHLEKLIRETWKLKIARAEVMNNTDVHAFVDRTETFKLCIVNNSQVDKELSPSTNIKINNTVSAKCRGEHDLTNLRVELISNVVTKLLGHLSVATSEDQLNIVITCDENFRGKCDSATKSKLVLVGPVLNDSNKKEDKSTSEDLFRARSINMQQVALHRYHLQIKHQCDDYFLKLGKASVVLELLQTKPHKAVKIPLIYEAQTLNKGPSFIFYNCARLCVLLKEFDKRVGDKVYPELPRVDEVNFGLLDQAEEWEILWAYVLQFPLVLKSCVSDIESGVVRPHNLVAYLSNLCCIFSTYYRRVKILTAPREHLMPVLFARIYLLKAVQVVFHRALFIMDIEPVTDM